MRRDFWLLLAGVVIGAVVFFTYFWPRDVKVVVSNTGSLPLQNLTVLVTGRSYLLGALSPGQSASVRVRPTSESSVRLQFTDAAGTYLLDADCYIEAGYRGRLDLDVANGAIVRKTDAIRLGIW